MQLVPLEYIDFFAKQSSGKAVEWYRKAAEKGLASAQYNLGLMYKNGEGVSVDYNKARKWFRKAAEQGHEGTKEALKNL